MGLPKDNTFLLAKNTVRTVFTPGQESKPAYYFTPPSEAACK